MKFETIHPLLKNNTEAEAMATFREAEKLRRQQSLICAIAALALIAGFMANVIAHFGR